jgi:hypothetical protein
MEDINDLLESLRRSPMILSGLVNTIPESRLNLRRGDGFWTVAEHVSHLAQVQPMLLERFQRFIREEHPVFVPYIPGGGQGEPATPPPMSMADAIERFTRTRHQQLVLLEGAGDSIWRRTATHPEYEAYSFDILARHTLMHDFWHMYRIEELWLTRDAFLTKLE